MANGTNYIGQRIGNYRIEQELASGGFGTVYLAKHTVLKNRTVAMKLLHAAHLGSQKERDQFIQEAQLLENLKHPHILPLLDVGVYNGVPYLVSEYAALGSLRNRLNSRRASLSPQEIITILTQIGQALQFAHNQNVIHRDLKPDNILFNAKGEALLADFGIATTLTTKSVQQVTVVGTFDYMAPEQFQGSISKESDQYAFGCVAYELATGRHPFDTTNIAAIINMHLNQPPTDPTQFNPHLPAHISQAILKALAKQRGDRHANIAAFITALQTAANASPVAPQISPANAPPVTPAPPPILPPTVPAGPLPAAKTPQTRDEWLKEGDIYYNAKRYEEALTAYEQAILLEPTRASTHTQRGNALYGLKRYDEALAAYNQALQLDRKFALAYYGKGNTFYKLHRNHEAYEAYEEALQLNAHLASACMQQGYIIYHYPKDPKDPTKRENDLRRALAKFEQAIRINSNLLNAYYGTGRVLYDLGRNAEALAAFQQVIRLDPNYAEAYYDMGRTLKRIGLVKEAQEAYEQARQLGYKRNWLFRMFE